MAYDRGVAVGDNHGIFTDWEASEKWFDFCREWKPKHRIHLGDCWDMTAIRAHASQAEENAGLTDDDTNARLFIDEYKPTVALTGNHEFRMYKLAGAGNGIKSDYAKKCCQDMQTLFDSIGCVLLPYSVVDGVHNIGGRNGLHFIHGFHFNLSSVRQYAAEYGNVITGHMHRNEKQPGQTYYDCHAECVGGLWDRKKLSYAHVRTSFYRWRQGASVFEIDTETGDHRTWLWTPSAGMM